MGSFDAQVAKGIVDSVQENVRQGFPDSVQLATELLTRLSQEAKFKNHKHLWDEFLIPSELLHDVVNAWRICWKEKTKELSPRTVFEMINAFEESFPSLIHRGVHPYDMIIHASVTLQDPDLAEEILEHLLKTNDTTAESRASVIWFSTVIDAWSKCGLKDAPAKAEAVLQKMIDYSADAGRMEVTPDVVTYNLVITAWANSNHEDAPHRAEELIRKMIARGLHPDVVSYASLLTAWARSKEDQAPDRAYAILKGMTAADVKPDAPCYSAVVSAYANQGNVQRAEQVLLEQCEHYKATKDRNVLPNAVCFNEVLHAWSKSSVPNLPHLVEEKLQQMYDLATSWDEPSLVPSTISFNAVLIAWAQSRDRDAPHRSEKILDRMQALYEQGHANCQPDVVSFNTILNCWARSSKREAPERAEAILHNMCSLCDAGVKPNAVSYNAVMNAWAHSWHPDAVFRANALFDEQQKIYEAGDHDMKPDLNSFKMIISAWGRSKHKDGGAQAQNVFNDMLARYKCGDADLKPDVAFYNTLIANVGRARDPERAEQILRDMDSREQGETKPSMKSYVAVMNAWSQSHKPNAVHQVQALFDELMQKYEAGDSSMKPDLLAFAALIRAWGRSKHMDRAAKAQAVFDNLLSFYTSGHEDLKPSFVAYNALISAWAHAGVPERAEQILREMESEVSLGIKPNVATYTIVMSGWSRSFDPKSADRMQGLYDEMNYKYLAGDNTVKPDAYTFGSILAAWRRTGRKDGLLKGEVVFRDMHDRFVAGEAELKPLVDEFGSSLSGGHWCTGTLRRVVTGQGTFLIMTGTSSEELALSSPPATSDTTDTLAQFLTQLPVSAESALKHIASTDKGELIAAAIQQHACIAVSDGSYKEGHGTASWVIEGADSEGRLQGNTLVPGEAYDQCSLRSELTGIYSVVLMVHSICPLHGITHGSVEIGCDSLDALYHTCSAQFCPLPTDTHFDLVVATRSIMAACPIQWRHRYIKGHQDNDPAALLDRWATLNVEMDLCAKLHWVNTHNAVTLPGLHIFGKQWSLWIRGTDAVPEVISSHIQEGAAKDKYLAEDNGVKPAPNTFGSILATWRRTGGNGLLKAEVVFRALHARFMSGEAELKPLIDEFESLLGGHR